MHTNNINCWKKQASLCFLFVLCKKSINTYGQSHKDLFLNFIFFLMPVSPKPTCVLGRYHCNLLHSTNGATYHLWSLGKLLFSNNHCLVKTVILVFHSWAIPVQWEMQTAPEKVLWWWCLLPGRWNGLNQCQSVWSAKKNHGNKTSTCKLTQMLCISHKLELAATTAEIISCCSQDSLIHHHIFSNEVLPSKGNLQTTAEPYLGPALNRGPT